LAHQRHTTKVDTTFYATSVRLIQCVFTTYNSKHDLTSLRFDHDGARAHWSDRRHRQQSNYVTSFGRNNRADNIIVPKTTAPAKCATFAATNITANFPSPVTCE